MASKWAPQNARKEKRFFVQNIHPAVNHRTLKAIFKKTDAAAAVGPELTVNVDFILNPATKSRTDAAIVDLYSHEKNDVKLDNLDVNSVIYQTNGGQLQGQMISVVNDSEGINCRNFCNARGWALRFTKMPQMFPRTFTNERDAGPEERVYSANIQSSSVTTKTSGWDYNSSTKKERSQKKSHEWNYPGRFLMSQVKNIRISTIKKLLFSLNELEGRTEDLNLMIEYLKNPEDGEDLPGVVIELIDKTRTGWVPTEKICKKLNGRFIDGNQIKVEMDPKNVKIKEYVETTLSNGRGWCFKVGKPPKGRPLIYLNQEAMDNDPEESNCLTHRLKPTYQNRLFFSFSQEKEKIVPGKIKCLFDGLPSLSKTDTHIRVDMLCHPNSNSYLNCAILEVIDHSKGSIEFDIDEVINEVKNTRSKKLGEKGLPFDLQHDPKNDIAEKFINDLGNGWILNIGYPPRGYPKVYKDKESIPAAENRENYGEFVRKEENARGQKRKGPPLLDNMPTKWQEAWQKPKHSNSNQANNSNQASWTRLPELQSAPPPPQQNTQNQIIPSQGAVYGLPYGHNPGPQSAPQSSSLNPPEFQRKFQPQVAQFSPAYHHTMGQKAENGGNQFLS